MGGDGYMNRKTPRCQGQIMCIKVKNRDQHSAGFLLHRVEMGDTSELCYSDDSLPRQTFAHSGLADRSTD